MIEYKQMLTLPQAQDNHRHSVRNWVDGNKPLVRSESSCFLNNTEGNDFVSLETENGDRTGLETLLEMSVRRFPRISRMVCTQLYRRLEGYDG
jgi:hypothetical protein